MPTKIDKSYTKDAAPSAQPVASAHTALPCEPTATQDSIATFAHRWAATRLQARLARIQEASDAD